MVIVPLRMVPIGMSRDLVHNGAMPEFLTTKEVAALLRIKERKVYELVAEQAIPVSRVTGKLLFPREMVEAWVWQQAEYAGGTEGLHGRPPVLAGSHDPLLEWALRESGSELAAFFDGSLDGLGRLAAGKAIAAGLHVYEPEAEDWNRGHLERAMAGMPVVLVEWAWRMQGLVVPPGNPKGIAGLGDLAGLTLMPRQERSGSHLLLDYLMRQAGPRSGAAPAAGAAGAQRGRRRARDRRGQGRCRVRDRDGGAPVPPRLRAAVSRALRPRGVAARLLRAAAPEAVRVLPRRPPSRSAPRSSAATTSPASARCTTTALDRPRRRAREGEDFADPA